MRSALAILLLLCASLPASAQSKPALPPGKPTSGFAVAVIAEGFDYNRPAVAARFARDGEGEAIAYDAVDDDRRPYRAAGETSALVERVPMLVVPIRVGATRELWLRALAFLKRSPARVAVVLEPVPREVMEFVLVEFKAMTDRLIFFPATRETKQSLPHSLTIAALPALGTAPVASGLADLVIAPATATREMPGAPGASPATAAEAALMAVGLFGCVDVSKARGPAEVAAAFISKGQRGVHGTAPILDVCGARR